MRVGVAVRVGVIVGVFVTVGVGQPPVGHGVGVSVGLGVFVIVGVLVMVGVGGSTTATAPIPSAGVGRLVPLTRERKTSWIVIALTPLLVPCSVRVARTPDPLGPAGVVPNVSQTYAKSPADTVGWKHVTALSVLPRNGPSCTPVTDVMAGFNAIVNSNAPSWVMFAAAMLIVVSEPLKIVCVIG